MLNASATSFWDSQLFAVMVTAGIFIVGGIVQYYRDRKNVLRAQYANLWMATNEVGFYRDRCKELLDILKKEVDKFEYLKKIASNNLAAALEFEFVPLFKFHPELLGDIRAELARLLEDPSIVAKIGEFHYALAGISQQLEEIRSTVDLEKKDSSVLMRLGGMYTFLAVGLSTKIPEFDTLNADLEQLVQAKNRELFFFVHF